jgi:valyl-tRNA synthetase
METLRRHSADATRYWAASTGLGKDSVISEEKIQAGSKLVTKLWNVASFSRRFLETPVSTSVPSDLSSADRWILASLQSVAQSAGAAFDRYDYATAKNDVETFFWRDLSDNYLEMAKRRLYDAEIPGHEAARYTLHTTLLTVLKLFAPILPYVTDEIFRRLFASDGHPSIHRSAWPRPDGALIDEQAVSRGQILVEIAATVRRYKSDRELSLGAPLQCLRLWTADPEIARWLDAATDDLLSVTRAEHIEHDSPQPGGQQLQGTPSVSLLIVP